VTSAVAEFKRALAEGLKPERNRFVFSPEPFRLVPKVPAAVPDGFLLGATTLTPSASMTWIGVPGTSTSI
jgi:hypothetical protein